MNTLTELLIEYYHGDARAAQEADLNYFKGVYEDTLDFAEQYYNEIPLASTKVGDLLQIARNLNWDRYAKDLFDNDFFGIELDGKLYVYERF